MSWRDVGLCAIGGVWGAAIWQWLRDWQRLRRQRAALLRAKTALEIAVDRLEAGMARWFGTEQESPDCLEHASDAAAYLNPRESNAAQSWANGYDFDDLEDLADTGQCPACRRMVELHRARPKLSVAQLGAVIDQQIALGHCPEHTTS